MDLIPIDELGPDAGIVPITDPLQRIGQELHLLAELVEVIQSDLGRLLESHPSGNREHVYKLQSLDTLKQYTTEIAKFSRTLALSACPSWTLDLNPALHGVVVADLKSRLDPLLADRPPVEAPPQGECQFF